MNSVVNCYVIDPDNIGDLLSSPINYFKFPTHQFEQADIRSLDLASLNNKHIIVGGGGLLAPRFLDHISQLASLKGRGKLIAWGVGQQLYGTFDANDIEGFDYSSYLEDFDLVGIRDFGLNYNWVPCVSCMHPAFEKKRDIKHEFVVFSHKKFQLKIDNFPRLTNQHDSIESVLDFLGSGETVLTSSYHGAYWATLLGRKVLAFPFTSKFHTLKHSLGIYPVKKWRQDAKRFYFFKKLIYEFKYKNKFSCSTGGWQDFLGSCHSYPDSLQECRDRNHWYYSQVLDLLS